MSCPAFVPLPRQKSTSGGLSESEVNELAVSARIDPSTSIAMTVTPVTNWPTVCRNVRGSIDISFESGRRRTLRLRPDLLDDRADVVRLDEIGRYLSLPHDVVHSQFVT